MENLRRPKKNMAGSSNGSARRDDAAFSSAPPSYKRSIDPQEVRNEKLRKKMLHAEELQRTFMAGKSQLHDMQRYARRLYSLQKAQRSTSSKIKEILDRFEIQGGCFVF